PVDGPPLNIVADDVVAEVLVREGQRVGRTFGDSAGTAQRWSVKEDQRRGRRIDVLKRLPAVGRVNHAHPHGQGARAVVKPAKQAQVAPGQGRRERVGVAEVVVVVEVPKIGYVGSGNVAAATKPQSLPFAQDVRATGAGHASAG